MRPAALVLLAAVTGALLSTSAHADTNGVVVRVATDGSAVAGSAVAVLTPEGGEPVEIALNDGGEPPDVDAGDGTWSGSEWLEGDAFAVSVRLGDQTHDAGRISWTAEDTMRDLSVTIIGGVVTAEASVSTRPPPRPGEVPGAAIQPPDQDPANPIPVPVPGTGSGPEVLPPADDGSLDVAVRPPAALATGPQTDARPPGRLLAKLFALAIGLVGVIALVSWWRRGLRGDGLGPLGLAPLDEPGLLGPGTPSLSTPVSIWSTSTAELAGLVVPLLGTVARHRVVCFLAPADLGRPKVFGGPVYPVEDAAELHDALDVLIEESRHRAMGFVVVEALEAEALESLVAGLPASAGLVVLTASVGEGLTADVSCRRDGERWAFRQGQQDVVAAVVADGLAPPTA